MVQVTAEVRKVLTVEFRLPGTEAAWSSGSGSGDRQLQQNGGERWQIKVDQRSAFETAAALEAVARAIRGAMT